MIIWFKRLLVAVASLLLVSFGASAQTQTAAAPAAAETQTLKPGEIEALVAPIALFPDPLVSLVLMAATYPLEVVQADRWVKSSKLKDDELKAALDKQAWDDSVKSLVATPSVLTMMSDKLDWTQRLGDAVLAQQEDVMDAIQRLRAKAQANDKLQTTPQQTVTVRQVDNRQVIAIQPTDPNTVYVPYYDPTTVYGAWPYAEYPPYYFPTPGWYAGGVVATGLAFGTGYALGRWVSGGNWWGGGFNWGNRNLIVNRPIDINNSGNNWQHRPEHRHGVRYSNANVAQKFAGGNNLRSSAGDRMDFRGKDARGGDRANLGDRGPGTGDRAGLGDRDRPDAGDRGKAGDRAGAGKAGDRAGAGKAGDRAGAAKAKGARDAKAGAGNRAGQAKSGQAKAAKGGNRPAAAARPAGGRPAAAGGGGPRRDAAFNMSSGRAANAQAMRGHASMGGRSFASGGGPRGGMSMGGGGFHGGGMGMRGGGGGFRGGGGGRRSDIVLKHDITLLGHLDNGLGFYRFSYRGDSTAYVGVMAQEVQKTMPHLVTRDSQGYLRVFYDRLGLKFQTWEQWLETQSPALAQAR